MGKVTKEKQPKKQILFNILDILRKYTDEKHRLSQKEIQDMLEKRYEMTVDRKTVKNSLMCLEEFGYEIEYRETTRQIKNKRNGEMDESVIYSDFFLRRDFEDSELRLLIDGLLFSRHLPYNQCKELVCKIEKLSNVYFKSRTKYIATIPHDRTNNQQLFHTIDVLDEAIANNKKVKFKYLEYNMDLSQTAKKTPDGEDRIYIVSPYQMVAKEGKYYLICNYDCYDDVSNYRIDRIHDVEITDEIIKPFEKLKGTDGQRLNLAQYMAEHVYMYSGNTSRIKMKVVKPMISDIIDMFGTNVTFMSHDETYVTISVRADEMAVCQFAKNFAPDVIVLSPKSVRKRVIDMLQQGVNGYNEDKSGKDMKNVLNAKRF